MELRVIPKEEGDAYYNYCDKVSYCIISNSYSIVAQFGKGASKAEVVGSTDEIGLAVGQILHDKIIDMTKDMSREELVKYLAESSFHMMTTIMNKHPEYKYKILFSDDLK